MRLYFRVSYSINKVLTAYVLDQREREGASPKKRLSLLMRKQVHYLGSWYYLLEAQIYKNFETAPEEEVCCFERRFFPKILFRFLEEVTKFLFLIVFTQLRLVIP